MSRTHAPLALLVALSLALTGCGGAQKMLDKAAPAPAPTAAFASEEEALAAAVAVYARYTELGDEIGHDGGRDAERLGEVAAGTLLDVSVAGFTGWIEKGWQQIGQTTFRDVVLQQFSVGPLAEVVIYVCEDISEVDVLDSAGQSIVAVDRPDSYHFQVTLESDADGLLKITNRERWDDATC